CQQYNSLPFTV
nr:immunoglobulin light chain junction region [Macaca mulatta]MPN95194.1 immunoglobulin light chain junction region [Macaca mulatta]MPN95664.1 immunoglobulin light chain junction region [Macaca mulatta]MPN98130.1 immunoglobulin light chain junction region [Macaca mulatta]